MAASARHNWRVPVSTSTKPSSVSNAVQPENCEANQVRGATSTGPPVQKNFASSGVLPRIDPNFIDGFCAMTGPVIYFAARMVPPNVAPPFENRDCCSGQACCTWVFD